MCLILLFTIEIRGLIQVTVYILLGNCGDWYVVEILAFAVRKINK